MHLLHLYYPVFMMWLSRCRFLWLTVLSLCALSPALAGNVVLVVSEAGGVYSEFGAALHRALDGSGWQVRWKGTVAELEPGGLPPGDVLIAAGSEAMRQLLARPGQTPLLVTLVPRQAYETALAETTRPRRSLVSAFYLDQPLSRVLTFVRQVLPDRRRVGVLLSPDAPMGAAGLRQALQAAGLALELEELESQGSVLAALNRLLPRSDVLLALPDATVFNRDNARTVLLTTLRHQKPMIGFSAAYVSAGALGAVVSSPAQLARQTAEWLRAQTPERVLLPPAQGPQYFSVALNPHVARALSLTIPDEGTILRAMTGKEGK